MAERSPMKKYEELGIDYNPWIVEPPRDEIVEQVCQQCRAAGLEN